jgi:hypothetical protein
MISGNFADEGGGISVYGASANVNRSTISNNMADFGGGIAFEKSSLLPSTMFVVHCTISGNLAVAGGGFWVVNDASEAGLIITGTSITQNHSDKNDANVTSAGGIEVVVGQIQINGSIVADNFKGSGTAIESDIAHDLALLMNPVSSYNLIGTGGSGGLVNGVNGNLVGVANPLLGPLANNGGPTLTHALLPGSPAIDAGNPGIVFDPVMFDQRGAPFVRVVDGDAVPGVRIDIGAVERQPIPAAIFGDYNQDGTVNAADYTVWRNTLGQSGLTPYSGADGDGDGTVDADDYGVWKSHFGMTLPGAGGSAQSAALMGEAEPQPPALSGVASAGSFLIANVRAVPPAKPWADARLFVASRSADFALLAWLAERANWPQRSDGLDVPGAAADAAQTAFADKWLPPVGDDWEVVLDELARQE